jgi:xanthine dehydrogenase YagS FAD-binding subunit
MNPFAYHRATSACDALEAATVHPGTAFVAGGTDFMQLWKEGITSPQLVIDIHHLPFRGIEPRRRFIKIGALARMSEVADHPVIRSEYPVLAEALLASASPQVRNIATIGGNLLQRTRCMYFRGNGFPCNKRNFGTGCAALEGENRLHAIFGASHHCAATHPSDLAVALVALDATVRVRGKKPEKMSNLAFLPPNRSTSGTRTANRTLPIEDFFLLPDERPERETALEPGELLIEIVVPNRNLARRSHYLKVRDRASFEFAVVSVAVALELKRGRICKARVAAGGVGTKPWRLRRCEEVLTDNPANESVFQEAASRAAEGAQPLSRNGFKLGLLRRAVFRALKDLAGLT